MSAEERAKHGRSIERTGNCDFGRDDQRRSCERETQEGPERSLVIWAARERILGGRNSK
jgi:hypothetical protein